MRNTWTFHSVGSLIFGNGAVNQLGPRCTERNWRRVLVVSDQHLVTAGIVPRVMHILEGAGLQTSLFDEGAAEPSVELAVRAAEQAKSFQPEAIIGLGGGSN